MDFVLQGARGRLEKGRSLAVERDAVTPTEPNPNAIRVHFSLPASVGIGPGPRHVLVLS
jgi:hypothetical protein